MDNEYFKKLNIISEYAPTAKVYDSDINFCAPLDGLLATYLGYKMYHDFAINKINQLTARGN